VLAFDKKKKIIETYLCVCRDFSAPQGLLVSNHVMITARCMSISLADVRIVRVSIASSLRISLDYFFYLVRLQSDKQSSFAY
jgi:hypothetical protein